MARYQALRANLRPLQCAALAAGMSVLAFGTGSTLALAQAKQPHGASSCPAGYEIVRLQPAYCTNSAGDIVEPVAAYRPASGARCPRGYESLWSVCFSAQTGDVVLPETQSGE